MIGVLELMSLRLAFRYMGGGGAVCPLVIVQGTSRLGFCFCGGCLCNIYFQSDKVKGVYFDSRIKQEGVKESGGGDDGGIDFISKRKQ